MAELAERSQDRKTQGGTTRRADPLHSLELTDPLVQSNAGEAPVQAKMDLGGKSASMRSASAVQRDVGPGVHALADRGISGSGGPLPHLGAIQKSFGKHDVSGVVAHTDDRAGEATRDMRAKGYTKGDHVALGGGASLHTEAHEAAHAMQQRAGVSLAGGAGSEGDVYERHADAVADAVVGGRSAESLLDRHAGGGQIGGAAVQQKVGDEDNVTFGLSGRDRAAIVHAVDAGYTTFDAADSYGGTLDLLVSVLAEKGVARDKVDIVYKLDATEPEAAEAHLRGVAGKLGGYIDFGMIHKATDRARAAKYRPILAKLEQEGVIKSSGAGDVTTAMDEELGMKSFEVNANDLLFGAEHEALTARLKQTGKPVFVYNIVNTAKARLGLGPQGRVTKVQVQALVAMIRNAVPAAQPILSSGTKDVIEENKAVDTIEDWDGVGQANTALERGQEAAPAAVNLDDMPEPIREKLTELAVSRDWSAASLFDTDQEYDTALQQQQARYTGEQLAVRYTNGVKTFTLDALLHHFFDKAGNCHRVEACNFVLGL